MSETNSSLKLMQNASADDAAIVARILADGVVPTVLWDTSAVIHYGVGITPLVRALSILPSPLVLEPAALTHCRILN